MGQWSVNDGRNEHARETAFAARLRRAREAAGLTQEALAERAGLTPNAIGALERGERRHPYPSTIRALADAVGMTDDERVAFAATVPKRGEAFSPVLPRQRFTAPLALTPLIGREVEVATVTAFIRDRAVRLVTLTGPGGVGKTSLALGIASELVKDFADGAVFVPLASVRDAEFVVSAVAQALGVDDTGQASLGARIGEFLRARHLLLVLDNFEHVLDAASFVTELLMRCEGLAVLVTSRAALRVSGERDVLVAPLALADPQLSDSTQIAGVAAVELFAERARAVDPSFALTVDNSAAVAAICRRLDGIPLAIELAAARSRLFTPTAFLARLEQRLPLLTSGRRDAPARHQTMRNAIAWSHDLLTPDEQRLFRRLALFAGGFTLAAAESVAEGGRREADETDAPSASRLPPSAFVDGVASLVEQRLVYRVEGMEGEPRLAMLETIREFAMDELIARGELRQIRDAHIAWCLALADEAAPHWFAAEQAVWADRIEAEHENLRAVLAYAMESSDSELGSRLVSRIWPFWIVRGHISEGWRWMEQVLARRAGDKTIERVRILTGAARFVRYLGEVSTARELGEEAWSLTEEIGVENGVDAAFVLVGLALTSNIRQDFAQSHALLERTLAILRPLKATDTRAAHLECLALLYLANVLVEFDVDERAMELAHEALVHTRHYGWAWGEIECLSCLAPLAYRRGEIAVAAKLSHEALILSVEQRDPWPIIMFLDFLGIVAGSANHAAIGARLIGAADHVATMLNLRPDSVRYNGRDRGIAVLRDMLGAATFDALIADGATITLDDALAEALALADQISRGHL